MTSNTNISTDGLVFSIDPFNTKSYNGVSNIVTDIVSGVTGSLVNGVTFSGRSFYFDGVNDYITIPSNTNFGSGDFTIIFWINKDSYNYDYIMDGLDSANTFGVVLGPGNGGELTTNSAINVYGGSKILSIGNLNGDVLYRLNIWHNFTIVRSGSVSKLYVDGVLRRTDTASGNFNSGSGLFIGNAGSGYPYWFSGKLSNITMYNRSLTITEILQNYNATKWRFEEHPIVEDGLVFYVDPKNTSSYPGTGTTVTSLRNSYSGTLNNGVTFDNISFGFDGSNDTIDFGTALNFSDTQAFTFNVWIRPETGISTNTYAVIMTIKAQSTFWQFTYSSDSTYNLVMGFAGTSYTTSTNAVPTTLIPINSWGCVTFVYNGGDKSVLSNYKIYINGQSVSLKYPGATGAPPNNKTIIGFRDGGAGNNYFLGKISNVMVYNRVLTQSEITQNYIATKNRFL